MKSWLGTREGRARKSVLCGDECESVSHTLWDCSAYRAPFLLKLLGGSYAHFSSLDKSLFVLGNELWEEHFESKRISYTYGRKEYSLGLHPREYGSRVFPTLFRYRIHYSIAGGRDEL